MCFHLCSPLGSLHKTRLLMRAELEFPLASSHVHMFISLYHTTSFSLHLFGSQHRYWAGLSPHPCVEMVYDFLIIQIWKQLFGAANQPLPPINHGVRNTVMTSKRPSPALLGCHVLPANVQEAHRACWSVKIQMVGSRWVMNAMLFPLICTQLPHADLMPSANQGWDNWAMWVDEISFHSKHVSVA